MSHYYAETKSYKNVPISYSGYNGIDGEKGHEYIEVNGTTPTAMTMKAFGYQSGYATVNYSWTGKEGCTQNPNGTGSFTQTLMKDTTSLVGTISPNVDNVQINLTSTKDLDIQLYGEDGTAIVSWKPTGLLAGATEQSIMYHDMNITWSGYNGTGDHAGHEYITVTPKTTEVLVMKVFGYEAGSADVTYSWGNVLENQAPTAVIADVDLNLTRAEFENIGVQLDATQSRDSDGRIIRYEWLVDNKLLTQTNKGTSYGIVSAISSNEPEGSDHTLSLKVTDDKGATDTKTVHFSILPSSAGFLVRPNLFNKGYGIDHVVIDTNTIPESNVSIVVTASKPNKLNGHTTKTLVFTPEKYKNISLYYSAPLNASENYIIHFDVSHSDDINYEGLQLEDINLTYNPEILRVNPPKGSKEFITGVKGTLEFIAYIDDMTANVIDERNVFYKGPIPLLKYELIDGPQGMVLSGDRLTWTPTQAQSNQSYTVLVKVSDGLVEKSVTFDVNVAENKYLHTEIQGNKLVVVEPNSNLNGMTIQAEDGGDISMVKIRVIDENLVPKGGRGYQRIMKKSDKISEVFLVENQPEEFYIGMQNVDALYTKMGTHKIAWAHYYSGAKGEKPKWVGQYFNDGKPRLTGWAFNTDKYYFLQKKKSTSLQGSKLKKSSSLGVPFSSGSCISRLAKDEYGQEEEYYEFQCSLSSGTILTIIDEQNINSVYQLWGNISLDDFTSWIDEAQNNVSTLGMPNINSGKIKISMEDLSTGGSSLYRHRDDYNTSLIYHLITLDNANAYYDSVRKNLAVHEYFHLSQSKALNGGIDETLEQNWKTEGTGKWFEDYGSFDSGDSYKVYYKTLNPLVDILSNGFFEKTFGYKKFAFWKMLTNNCKNDIVKDIFINNLTYEADINTLTSSISECDFGIPLDNNLASAFAYYSWATLQEKKMSLLDPNESDVGYDFENNIKIFSKDEWNDGKLDLISGVPFGKILPFGAISFRIDADILSKTEKPYPMQFNIKTDNQLDILAVRLTSSNISTLSGISDNFHFNTQEQNEYNLTDTDRSGGLFITLTNTSNNVVSIEDMNLTAKRFTRDDDTEIVTDHERGLQWQDISLTLQDSWYAARRECNALTMGGYTDWRLPTYVDLIYILDMSGPPYIYDTFEHLGPVGYWSSDRSYNSYNEEVAKVVSFGYASWLNIRTSSFMNTRCVRDLATVEASPSAGIFKSIVTNSLPQIEEDKSLNYNELLNGIE